MRGNRPLDQSKRPLSTTTPPMDVPWPPMNFVAEWITTSAPCSNGRHRYGVATVESTTSGTPTACAACESAARSATTPAGLATVSVKKAFVSGLAALAKASGSSGATKVVSIPRRRRETSEQRAECTPVERSSAGHDVIAGAGQRREQHCLACGLGHSPRPRPRSHPRGWRCAPRRRRRWGWRFGCRCSRTSAGRTGPPRLLHPRRRSSWSGISVQLAHRWWDRVGCQRGRPGCGNSPNSIAHTERS